VLVDGWQSMSSPVEYWFFRTSWEGGALLVDFIRRRDKEHGEIRVTSSQGGIGRLDRTATPRDRVPGGADDECLLDQHRSRGDVGAVVWDLSFTRKPSRLTAPPSPLHRARTFDLSLVSWPDLTCTGAVTVDGVDHFLDAAPGMACHYWGRRLPDRWVWLSANEFDRPGVAVEASLLTSRLWGAPVPLPPLGYAWLREAGREWYVASPLTGLVRRTVRKSGGGLQINVTAPRRSWTLTAAANAQSFIDLGDGILQSLRADCLIRTATGVTAARGTAVLELRDERWSAAGVPTS
jgi:hypothetical protein